MQGQCVANRDAVDGWGCGIRLVCDEGLWRVPGAARCPGERRWGDLQEGVIWVLSEETKSRIEHEVDSRSVTFGVWLYRLTRGRITRFGTEGR